MRPICLWLALGFLLTTASRLPAPIVEETTPTPIAKPKTSGLGEKGKSSTSGDRSSRGFDGKWRATWSTKMERGTVLNNTQTLIIKKGFAEMTLESTGKLGPSQTWQDLPGPYNSVSPIYKKGLVKSRQVTLEGTKLTIRWPSPATLVDWAPKTIPYGLLARFGDDAEEASLVYTVNGDRLTVTGYANGKTGTYMRVR